MNKIIKKLWNSAQSQANKAAILNRRIAIDPITRLEGHGKIDIFLDDSGNVERAFFQVPELRGFEAFCRGRPAEDMPQLTSRICGVCPTAHHMAATKALDCLYQVEVPRTASIIRELVYSAFMFEDHALHIYILGGPDFIVGPDAPKQDRNIIGVLNKVGLDVGKKVISIRRRTREFIGILGGKVIHPVLGLPGGVARMFPKNELKRFQELGQDLKEFALFTLKTMRELLWENNEYRELITSDVYTHKTYYMGMVDEQNRVNFYDGTLRIVTAEGKEFASFGSDEYLNYVAEHVEPWSYIKFCYLKQKGWGGFKENPDNGIYAVAPLARLNVAEGMATPKAQEAYEEFFELFGSKPVHNTLANHWARVVEMLYAAERFNELIFDPELLNPNIRKIPSASPKEGFGVVEAPRGTLFHHYKTDPQGLITNANLIVATQNNAARIAMSVEKAAKSVISEFRVSDQLLNLIEMAFRAYDPCHGCGTHALSGKIALQITIYDQQGQILQELCSES